jgi:hypothetical protein
MRGRVWKTHLHPLEHFGCRLQGPVISGGGHNGVMGVPVLALREVDGGLGGLDHPAHCGQAEGVSARDLQHGNHLSKSWLTSLSCFRAENLEDASRNWLS